MPPRQRRSRFVHGDLSPLSPGENGLGVGPSENPFSDDPLLANLWSEPKRNDAVAAVDQLTSEWEVRWVLARQRGAYTVRSVTLRPATEQTPTGGVTSNLLRELSPTTAVAIALSGSPQSRGDALLLRGDELTRGVLGPEDPPEGKRGRPQVPEIDLLKVALLYLHEQQAGAGLMERLGGHLDLPPGTVRDRVRMARDRHLLTPAQRGRRGAGVGSRLREIAAAKPRMKEILDRMGIVLDEEGEES